MTEPFEDAANTHVSIKSLSYIYLVHPASYECHLDVLYRAYWSNLFDCIRKINYQCLWTKKKLNRNCSLINKLSQCILWHNALKLKNISMINLNGNSEFENKTEWKLN